PTPRPTATSRTSTPPQVTASPTRRPPAHKAPTARGAPRPATDDRRVGAFVEALVVHRPQDRRRCVLDVREFLGDGFDSGGLAVRKVRQQFPPFADLDSWCARSGPA